ncbi:protein of unknown function DUF224 cysteine-rich region domain protein [Isosphaera pallida ATCC 43644]|uniref:4Fe-4S ferredoxin-type domain-containing protein n=1 Tax=Isosphaera pallida (strain ATCC 43644 / DSM 9630 / IS1B) TaxID=575540 RepID=E8R1W8_ISOPI|nr:(Fe-S)-binding protein [Isosphaera pallida]ADV61390.1 protein of unknown function DUF224 cysteine-rich region domain protein [Isosphaera pallida ATCC 43644]
MSQAPTTPHPQSPLPVELSPSSLLPPANADTPNTSAANAMPRFELGHSLPNPNAPARGSVTEPGIDLDWLNQKIDYRRFQECVHCGLCTASCPTYVVTGDENDSPRGRIHLMRSIVDGRLALSDPVRHHLDLCLDCRACETACPSGVQYAHLIEPFHIAMHRSAPPTHQPSWLRALMLRHLFPYANRVKLAMIPARIMQKLGLLDLAEKVGVTKLLPPTLRRMAAMVPDGLEAPQRFPEVAPPIGPKRATVAFLTGCVADAMYPGTNAATIRVLQHNGCEVHVPKGQTCCGAIHYHSGADQPALAQARANLRAFAPNRYDAIIVNAAGCGAMFKDYAHILPESDREAARAFVAKVRDIAEFLVELGPIPPTHPVNATVTYHDACHLRHGQQIERQPRQLLAMIPGLTLVPLEESELCCGAAGTYNLTQPEMSETLGRRKMSHIAATQADYVATGNVGCILQIARKIKETGAPMRCVHPIDLLDASYTGHSLPAPPKRSATS